MLHFSSPEFGKGEENEINCVNMVNSTVNKRTYHIESFFYMSIHVFYRQSLVNKIWKKLLSSENHRLGVRIVLLTNKTVLLALKKEILSPFARNCLCLPRVPFEVMGVMYC